MALQQERAVVDLYAVPLWVRIPGILPTQLGLYRLFMKTLCFLVITNADTNLTWTVALSYMLAHKAC